MTLELMKQEERRKGEEKGEKKRALKIAANMLKQGYSCEQIAGVTELSIEDIKSLQMSMNNTEIR